MDVFLQFGHGMKKISIDMSKAWGTACAILSPRDISPEQLAKWKIEFEKANVNTLFDPQCYYPKTNHPGLKKYKYWDSSLTTNLEKKNGYEEGLIDLIYEYNQIAGCGDFIIPSPMLVYDNNWQKRWLKQSEKFISAAKKQIKGKSHILTLAIPDSLLLQEESVVEDFISAIEELDVDIFYLVANTPAKQYLVDAPMWLCNLMQICAAIKLLGKKVIMGYANHQLLCLSAAGVDAIATGTYLNVRFFYNKFEVQERMQKKSIWYYYPAALSEYNIGFMDVAYSAKVIQQMKPSQEMDRGYVDLLFGKPKPSSTGFSETLAFKHYLNCVKVQAKNISKKTFLDTISANEVLLETAIRRIEVLEKYGVFSRARSFKDSVDVNRAALQMLRNTRGYALAQEWNSL